MSGPLKWSPLCARHDGREVYFTAKTGDRKLSVVFPKEFLDRSCGATASETARKSWVKEHREQLLTTLTTSTPLPDALNAILIEEIS